MPSAFVGTRGPPTWRSRSVAAPRPTGSRPRRPQRPLRERAPSRSRGSPPAARSSSGCEPAKARASSWASAACRSRGSPTCATSAATRPRTAGACAGGPSSGPPTWGGSRRTGSPPSASWASGWCATSAPRPSRPGCRTYSPDSSEAAYLRLPVQHGDHEPTAVFERIRNGDYGWISEQFMLEGYIEGLDRHAHVWASYLRALAQARQRPLLFHCTGGKDRTGAAAALTLLALGVPEATVVADYGLSDGCNIEVRRRVYDYLRQLNVDLPTVEPYFTAPPEPAARAAGPPAPRLRERRGLPRAHGGGRTGCHRFAEGRTAGIKAVRPSTWQRRRREGRRGRPLRERTAR